MASVKDIVLLGFCLLLQVTSNNAYETLKFEPATSYILRASQAETIPIGESERSPLQVTAGLSLVYISDVDEERNEVELIVWQETFWPARYLAWDTSEPEMNVKQCRIPTRYLWTPDLAFFNSAGASEILSPQIAVVTFAGNITWIPNIKARLTCNLENVATAQGATCNIKLGSWTYSGKLLALNLLRPKLDLSNYITNPKYKILSTAAWKETKYYPCCPEPYETIHYNITIKKLYGGLFSFLSR